MEKKSIVINLNDENFEKEVIRSKVLFMVNFGAEWSGLFHIMTPVIEALAIKFKGQVKMGNLDIDNNTKISARYGIISVPLLLFFEDGEIVQQIFGAISRKELSEKISSLLKK
jgi:thioredoxin 1